MVTEKGVQAANALLATAVQFAKPEYKELLRSIQEYYEKYGVLSNKQCKIVVNTLHYQILHPVKEQNV